MKLSELDLHGLSHDNARKVIRLWIRQNPPPCKIITGNSAAMEKIVREELEEDIYRCEYESYHNLGALIVTRR